MNRVGRPNALDEERVGADGLREETQRLLAGGLTGNAHAVESFLRFLLKWLGVRWVVVGTREVSTGRYVAIATSGGLPRGALDLPTELECAALGAPLAVEGPAGDLAAVPLSHGAASVLVLPRPSERELVGLRGSDWRKAVHVLGSATAALAAHQELLALEEQPQRSSSEVPTRIGIGVGSAAASGPRAADEPTRQLPASTGELGLETVVPTRRGLGSTEDVTRPVESAPSVGGHSARTPESHADRDGTATRVHASPPFSTSVARSDDATRVTVTAPPSFREGVTQVSASAPASVRSTRDPLPAHDPRAGRDAHATGNKPSALEPRPASAAPFREPAPAASARSVREPAPAASARSVREPADHDARFAARPSPQPQTDRDDGADLKSGPRARAAGPRRPAGRRRGTAEARATRRPPPPPAVDEEAPRSGDTRVETSPSLILTAVTAPPDPAARWRLIALIAAGIAALALGLLLGRGATP